MISKGQTSTVADFSRAVPNPTAQIFFNFPGFFRKLQKKVRSGLPLEVGATFHKKPWITPWLRKIEGQYLVKFRDLRKSYLQLFKIPSEKV